MLFALGRSTDIAAVQQYTAGALQCMLVPRLAAHFEFSEGSAHYFTIVHGGHLAAGLDSCRIAHGLPLNRSFFHSVIDQR